MMKLISLQQKMNIMNWEYKKIISESLHGQDFCYVNGAIYIRLSFMRQSQFIPVLAYKLFSFQSYITRGGKW